MANEQQQTKELSNNKLYPIIVDITDGRCLVWDAKNEDWLIKEKDQVTKKWKFVPGDNTPYPLAAECWCKAKLYIREGLDKKTHNTSLARFQKQHEKCGVRKNRPESATKINYNIL